MGEQILKNSSFWCYLVVALKFQSGLTFFQSIASLFGAGGRHSECLKAVQFYVRETGT